MRCVLHLVHKTLDYLHSTHSEYLEVYDSKTENVNDCICAWSDEELKEKLEKMIKEEELYAKI